MGALAEIFVVTTALLSLIFCVPTRLFPRGVLSVFLAAPNVTTSNTAGFHVVFDACVLRNDFVVTIALFRSLNGTGGTA